MLVAVKICTLFLAPPTVTNLNRQFVCQKLQVLISLFIYEVFKVSGICRFLADVVVIFLPELTWIPSQTPVISTEQTPEGNQLFIGLVRNPHSINCRINSVRCKLDVLYARYSFAIISL